LKFRETGNGKARGAGRQINRKKKEDGEKNLFTGKKIIHIPKKEKKVHALNAGKTKPSKARWIKQ
jgi:hypothetical protein